ncbi:MAG: tetratricopeptide repeat protein [Phormidesmis sp. RL_2_1]|nr:tetratricopeptide repeat protein [Phormidesmis sp. RL_2_1]
MALSITLRMALAITPAIALGLTFAAKEPAYASRSLTEQLHTPQQEDIRSQRDVADQFLLLGQEQLAAGNHAAAITALDAAVNAYHYLGDFVGMGEAYEQLVKVHSSLGQYDAAESLVRQQLAIARSNYSFSDQILALNNLGTLSLQSGDLDTAWEAFSEGLTIAQDVQSQAGIGLSLSNLGLVAAAQGHFNDARKYYEVAANYRARARDYVGQANTDNNLGDVYWQMGHTREAIGAYRLALSRARNIDQPYIQLRAIDGLIAIYRQRHEPSELTRYLNERIALTLSTGDDWQRLMTLKTLGTIYQDNGEFAAARDAFRRALSLAQAMEHKTMQAELSNLILALPAEPDS